MKTYNYNSMSSRERDCLVAEKVMVWRWWLFPPLPPDGKPFQMLLPPNENWPRSRWKAKCIPSKAKGVLDETDISTFQPSTNDADAMAVVKKMREQGFFVVIDGSQDWRVWFRRRGHIGFWRGTGLASGIAIASLRACGCEMDDGE